MAITCPRCGAEFDATLFEFDNIENGVHGRDAIVALARRLAGLDIRSAG